MGLEWTFNTAVADYDKMRPGYVKELYNDIFAYCPISPESCVIEVGIGSGQATQPILDTGCTLTAIEYGEKMSQVCRTKFANFSRFSVVTKKFEDFSCPSASVDLVYSATAFHWLPEEIGYSKVYDILKPGGAFARFANHPFPCKIGSPLYEAIQEIYRKYRGSSFQPLNPYTVQDAEALSAIAGKYGFCNLMTYTYHRTRIFTATEYIALLCTYSNVIAMEETVRSQFLAEIGQAINCHGGTLTIYDTIDMQLARKP